MMWWLWVLILALVGGLALTCWGLWWLWHKVTGLGSDLDGVLKRLDDLGEVLDQLDLGPLDEGTSPRGGKGRAW